MRVWSTESRTTEFQNGTGSSGGAYPLTFHNINLVHTTTESHVNKDLWQHRTMVYEGFSLLRFSSIQLVRRTTSVGDLATCAQPSTGIGVSLKESLIDKEGNRDDSNG
jgi:hypothetical protein